MSRISSTYIIVRVDVEHDDKIQGEELDEMLGMVEAEMDYDFTFKEGNIEIVDTEICGRSEEF